MRLAQKVSWLGVVVVLATAAFASARAQDLEPCEPPELRPIEVTPASGASGVTVDAPIKVRYPAGYLTDPIRCPTPPCETIEVDYVYDDLNTGLEVRVPVLGTTVVIGDVLVFTPRTDTPRPPQCVRPRGHWCESAEYEGVATGDDGDLAFSFMTGRTTDVLPPDIGAITSISSSRTDPSCDAPEGRYRIDVSFEPARDDGPRGSIEYLVYLTRGPTVVAPELRARRRNFSTTLVTTAFVLERDEGVSPICVQVQAIDGIDGEGHRAATPTRCIDPHTGDFFEPLCAASAPGGGGAAPRSTWWALALLSGCAVARRLARRR